MTETAAPASGQLGLPGMPVRLFSCTPSRLGTWSDCPRRYRFAYVDRPPPAKGPPWAHSSLGASVHAALRSWWAELPRRRRTPAAGGALLESGWSGEGFRDDGHSATWRARAREWVESYLATADPDDEPVGVERQVAARTATLAFSGRIDRLDRRGDELVVVDYKTGRRPPDEHDARASSALALYAVAAGRTLRADCFTVELHHLPTGTVAAWRHTPESLERHVHRAEDTAADAVAAVTALGQGADPDAAFPPSPGPSCGLCDYRRHCPEGRAAAPEREPWSALAE